MEFLSKYEPEMGDIVSVMGEHGPFEIIASSTAFRSADVSPVGSTYLLREIPWFALTLLKQTFEN